MTGADEAGQSRPLEQEAETPFLSCGQPYNWPVLRDFLRTRLIPELEWCGDDCYGRTLGLDSGAVGWFTATYQASEPGFRIELGVPEPADRAGLLSTVSRVLDLEADSNRINAHLAPLVAPLGGPIAGLRLPGTASLFEAGVRAILGQQVSVAAAHRLIEQLVQAYGTTLGTPGGRRRVFPAPARLAATDLAALRLPGQRKQSVIALATLFRDDPERAGDPDNWRSIRGIGPWTVQYARMRGLSDRDIWLGSDLGVQRALERQGTELDPAAAAPWRSYLTLHCWTLT